MDKIICGNCSEVIGKAMQEMQEQGLTPVIVTDPPFNIGYKYKNYKDKMRESEYYRWLANIIGNSPAVIIHYPEKLHRLSIEMQRCPERVVEWVYNSNTARQHRSIGFYGIEPKFDRVRQPYKNLQDKRIQQRIADGKTGAKIYDWWNVNQVKNVNKDKTAHPCQMPVEVMNNIVKLISGGGTNRSDRSVLRKRNNGNSLRTKRNFIHRN